MTENNYLPCTSYCSNRCIWNWPDTHRPIAIRITKHIFTINLGG